MSYLRQSLASITKTNSRIPGGYDGAIYNLSPLLMDVIQHTMWRRQGLKYYCTLLPIKLRCYPTSYRVLRAIITYFTDVFYCASSTQDGNLGGDSDFSMSWGFFIIIPNLRFRFESRCDRRSLIMKWGMNVSGVRTNETWDRVGDLLIYLSTQGNMGNWDFSVDFCPLVFRTVIAASSGIMIQFLLVDNSAGLLWRIITWTQCRSDFLWTSNQIYFVCLSFFVAALTNVLEIINNFVGWLVCMKWSLAL